MDLSRFTDEWQMQRQQLFKSVPPEGRMVSYLGKEFWVFPDTFWPFADSLPLVRNFRVEPGEHVLDVGTGSGVIGLFACYKGAGRVVGVRSGGQLGRRLARERGRRTVGKLDQGGAVGRHACRRMGSPERRCWQGRC
ncbi:hypothetical protein FKK32_29335 [Klebsiella pneumoniae]|nr:hypothetical protein [Klebsiella pneumoniae]